MAINSLKGVISAILDLVDATRSLSFSTVVRKTSVKQTSVQSIPNSAWTALDFDSLVHGLPDWDFTNKRYVAPHSDFYDIFASLRCDFASYNGLILFTVGVFVNGSEVSRGGRLNFSSTAHSVHNLTVCASVYLNAGDYVEIKLYQQSGASRNTEVGSIASFSSASRESANVDYSTTPSYLLKTSVYTLTNTDDIIVYGDTDGSAFTITLPASPIDGKLFEIKNTGTSTNNLTVARNGQTIDGSASNLTLTDNESVKLQYTSDGWKILA